MTTSKASKPSGAKNTETQSPIASKGGSGILLAVIVLIIGVAAAVIIMKTGPKAEKQARPVQARLVSVMQVKAESHPIELSCLGTVRAKQRVALRPQVSGLLVSVADGLVPGTVVREGDLLFQIDPTDYEIQVLAKQAELDRAEAALALEMGQQEVARQDYALTRQSLSGAELDLVMRGPQLRQAQANVAAAQAQLRAARTQLERAAVRAPFDAIVLRIPESEGTLVSASSVLTEIAGVDAFWVELALPPKDLKWIETGEDGSSIRFLDDLSWGETAHRSGRVVNVSPQQHAQSQTMTVLAEIIDPLALDEADPTAPEVHLDSILRAQISGKTLDRVVKLPRSLVQKNDIVYVASGDDTLAFREVDVVFRGPDYVLIQSGLQEGENVVTSILSSPVEGMRLRYPTQMREAVEKGDSGSPRPSKQPLTQS